MKILVYLFSFWILLMSVMPCADQHESMFKNETENTNDQEQKMDWCSPFCICTCCAGIILQKSSCFDFQKFIITMIKYYSSYFYIFSSTYIYTHWQPPKI